MYTPEPIKAMSYIDTVRLLYSTTKSQKTFVNQVVRLTSIYSTLLSHLPLVFHNVRPIRTKPSGYYIGVDNRELTNVSGRYHLLQGKKKMSLGAIYTIDELITSLQLNAPGTELYFTLEFCEKMELNDDFMALSTVYEEQ